MASAAAGVLGAGVGLYQTIEGSKQARNAQKALEEYQRQEFQNIAEGMQVSTLGADLQREEQQRVVASQIDALQGAGTRGIVGGLGRVEAGNQAVNKQIGADLDMQQKQIDQIKAQDEARIRDMQENREMQDISALSSQYNTGQQNMMSGLGNVIAGTGQSALGVQNYLRERGGKQPIDINGNVITANSNTSGQRTDTNFNYNPNR